MARICSQYELKTLGKHLDKLLKSLQISRISRSQDISRSQGFQESILYFVEVFRNADLAIHLEARDALSKLFLHLIE